MADYYLDADLGTNGTGTSGSPFNNLQAALNAATTGGDTIYATGTEAPSTVTTTAYAGSVTTGHIKILGCDGSWTPGAEQFTMDGQSNGSLTLLDQNHGWLEFQNITFKDSYRLVDGNGGPDYSFWKQCIFEDAITNPFYYGYGNAQATWLQCIFRNGGLLQYGPAATSTLLFCTFDGVDFYNMGGCLYYGCVFKDGISTTDVGAYTGMNIVHCIIHNNTSHGLEGKGVDGGALHVIGSRITRNGGVGLQSTNTATNTGPVSINNVYYNNSSGNRSTGVRSIGDLDATTVTEEGYTDESTGDFNLTTDAIGRSIENILDWE